MRLTKEQLGVMTSLGQGVRTAMVLDVMHEFLVCEQLDASNPVWEIWQWMVDGNQTAIQVDLDSIHQWERELAASVEPGQEASGESKQA